MKRVFLLALAFILITSPSFAQTSKNMSLLGKVTFANDLNDIWGYVFNSKEYALVGKENGVAIVDVTVPTAPVLLQTLPGVTTVWRDLKTWGKYAYVTNEGGDGLRIINLTNLPGAVTYKDTIINGMSTSHNLYIDENGYLYMTGGPGSKRGFTILNLNIDPWRPQYVGEWNVRYLHDIYVRNDTAYASEINDGLLDIIDVSNKTAPVSLGSKSYINSFTHNAWLNDAGNICFTTDELSAAYIYAWDVTDPGNIIEVDKIRSSISGGTTTPHNVHVLNDYIITSYYKDGVHLIDAARPHNMIEMGWFDTNTLTGGGTEGCWGAYPFLPSGIVLGTDMGTGLHILAPTYIRGCYLEGIVTDSVTGLPINGATVAFTSPALSELTKTTGEYATGLADAGTYSVTYSKFGYYSKTISYSLSNGVLTTGNVALAPIATFAFTINVVQAGTLAPLPGALVDAIETSSSAVLNYTADGSGKVVDPSFIAATYDFYVGKWGSITKKVTMAITPGTPSITIELSKGYYDDFYFDFNWTNTATASSGDWERGEPVGTSDFTGYNYNPDLDVTMDLGDQAYVTGNGGGSVGNDDIDNGNVILTSPVMDLTSYTKPVLKYHRWFANGGGGGDPINDSLLITINNGLTTISLKKVFGGFDNIWRQDTFDLESLIAITNNMKVSFTAGDWPSGHVAEAGVDNFMVIDNTPVGISETVNASANRLVVYPNPMTNQAFISWSIPGFNSNSDSRIEIRDIMGRIVESHNIQSSVGGFEWKFKGPAGMYFAAMVSGNEILNTFKIVKE